MVEPLICYKNSTSFQKWVDETMCWDGFSPEDGCIYALEEYGSIVACFSLYDSNTNFLIERGIIEIREVPKYRLQGSNYWFVDECGNVLHTIDMNSVTDKCRFNAGNYFKDPDEASVYAKKILKLFKDELK